MKGKWDKLGMTRGNNLDRNSMDEDDDKNDIELIDPTFTL